MLKRLFMLCLGLLAASVGVQARSLLDFQRALTTGTHYSLSRQFVIHDLPPADTFPEPHPDFDHDTNLVQLDPTLLAVSCDRIKKSLLYQLGARDEWRGKIYIELHRARTRNDAISVTPVLTERGWMFRLDVPDRLERQRLVSAVVEVLMLEMADRNAAHSTEIPTWLSQGMAREVMFGSEENLVIDPPHKVENGLTIDRLVRTNLFGNPLVEARQELQSLPPLTLEQLSWPGNGQFDGAAADQYASSAQLFVHELLQLRDGHQCFQKFLPELGQHFNWQMAFLRAFHSDFGSQLELEKWWALRLVQFTGRNVAQTWGAEDSWQKLDEIVRPFVEVRTGTNDMPLHTQVTLQEIIRDWDVPRQNRLLAEKAQQLLLLRLHVSQDLVYLVDDYRRTLDAYVKRRDSGGFTPMGRTLYAPRLDDLARETLRALDVLEARRQQLRPKPQSAPVITANSQASR